MKKLWPLERTRSGGGIGRWATLIVVISIGCLPVSSASASPHGGGGGVYAGGGGHVAGGGSSHFSGGGGAGSHFSAGQFSSRFGRQFNPGSGTSFYSSSATSRTVTRHGTSLNQYQSKAAINHGGSVNRFTTASRGLAGTNVRDVRNGVNAQMTRSTITYNRSLTASQAQTLMNQRLNQISNRQWTGHGAFYADHRDHRFWFHHGGYWWRCNYWGAHWYCNHLIAVGFAPWLRWAWYDDICWGNIVIGMPLDLVDYYYPNPVYSSYTDYEGQKAIVYYYAMDNGQYTRVTVVDGNVVDVQIVDQIS